MIGPVTNCPVCGSLRPMGWTCPTCFPSSAAVRPETPSALAAPVADTTHEPQTAADMVLATCGPTPDVRIPAPAPSAATGAATRVPATVERWLEPQPPPVGGRVSVVGWLLADLEVFPREPRAELIADILRARRAQGVERYGTELLSHNGRNATADALQEAVDLLLYVAQRQIEDGWPYSGRLTTVYGLVRWLAEELEAEHQPGDCPDNEHACVPCSDAYGLAEVEPDDEEDE